MIGGRVLDPTAVMAMAAGTSEYAAALLQIATEMNIPLAVPATALLTAWSASEPDAWPWLDLLPEAATVVVIDLDERAAKDAGLLACLSGNPGTHPAVTHAAYVGLSRDWPVVTRRPDIVQALSERVRTETMP